jgi:hypothetical protein
MRLPFHLQASPLAPLLEAVADVALAQAGEPAPDPNATPEELADQLRALAGRLREPADEAESPAVEEAADGGVEEAPAPAVEEAEPAAVEEAPPAPRPRSRRRAAAPEA